MRLYERRLRREHLDMPLTVEDLARRAQDLLENTDDTIERIASLCGFGSARQLRTHFTRINHVTPHAYQRTFRSRVAPDMIRTPTGRGSVR